MIRSQAAYNINNRVEKCVLKTQLSNSTGEKKEKNQYKMTIKSSHEKTKAESKMDYSSLKATVYKNVKEWFGQTTGRIAAIKHLHRH